MLTREEKNTIRAFLKMNPGFDVREAVLLIKRYYQIERGEMAKAKRPTELTCPTNSGPYPKRSKKRLKTTE